MLIYGVRMGDKSKLYLFYNPKLYLNGVEKFKTIIYTKFDKYVLCVRNMIETLYSFIYI